MNQKGITLVEVLIGTLIFVLVGGLLLGILVQNTGLFYQQSAVVKQGVGSNESLTSIRSTIKQAESVATQYPTVGQAQYTSGASQIVLKLGSLDSSGNSLSGYYDYYVYYLSSGRLKLKILPDAQSSRKSRDQVLVLNVSSILFEYQDASGQTVNPNLAKKVKFTLTLQEKAGTKNQTNIATSEAQLRND